jgi:mono/diheme cytochrome c family protein
MEYTLMALGIYLLVSLFLFVIRNKVKLFWTASLFYMASAALVMKGIDPPVPASIVMLFNVTIMAAMLLYVSAGEDSRQAFFGPIVAMMVEKRLIVVRVLFLLVVPTLLAWQGYQASLPSDAPPPRVRMVHPPPPIKLKFKGLGEEKEVELNLLKVQSPVRELEDGQPEKFKEKLAQGKTIYYQNCYYCHGDRMAADGHYADAVRPPPASFTDQGTLPMLSESFLFWRVAKGGPGLPDGSTPWDSTMPAWEKFLTQDQIWSVIAYLYEHTGYRPRSPEPAEGH